MLPKMVVWLCESHIHSLRNLLVEVRSLWGSFDVVNVEVVGADYAALLGVKVMFVCVYDQSPYCSDSGSVQSVVGSSLLER